MSATQIVWLEFDYMDRHYEGEAIPAPIASNESPAPAFDIYFDNEYTGTIIRDKGGCTSSNFLDGDLLKILTCKLSSYLSRAIED